mmetsp:Transcript_85133/g.237581  ORF Transcript_85133/g.237581 Transcript_85133/m.237581 type:complete len:80 (-) Transcript_85133:10-249(-)
MRTFVQKTAAMALLVDSNIGPLVSRLLETVEGHGRRSFRTTDERMNPLRPPETRRVEVSFRGVSTAGSASACLVVAQSR